MPTYEYECASCRRVFEHVQPITAKPLRKYRCPHCARERPVRRLIGGGGALLFKGSGFHQTDYRSESYHKAAKSESGASEKKDAAGSKDSAKPHGDASASTSSESQSKPAKKKPSGSSDA